MYTSKCVNDFLSNRREAIAKDKGKLYVDLDTDLDLYGVFGEMSGFCYSLHYTEEQAQEIDEVVISHRINKRKR